MHARHSIATIANNESDKRKQFLKSIGLAGISISFIVYIT